MTNNQEINIDKIKYYPDRFYICVDGIDIQSLDNFGAIQEIGLQHAVFIHEYYHYLTNITTFAGIRSFNLNFCGRFKLTTKLSEKEGLNAFSIDTNSLESCKTEIEDWNDIMAILDNDDINYNVVEKTASSLTKNFQLLSVQRKSIKVQKNVDGEKRHLQSDIVEMQIEGLQNLSSFNLTFGAIDEFLSSAIDEYLFENGLSPIEPSELNKRPFYPYLFFDKLLLHYDIRISSALEKIYLSYFSLHSSNPPVVLVEILEKLKAGDYLTFQENPERYLTTNFPEVPMYDQLLDQIAEFSKVSYEQGRIHISQALKYFFDKFYIAQKLKEKDLFYFIRPFLVIAPDKIRLRQRFLLELSRILSVYMPPVLLQNKTFVVLDHLTTLGESTLHILATYEILESLKKNQIAKRPNHQKSKYTFPFEKEDSDDFRLFTPPPISGSAFKIALNELGLYGTYLQEAEKLKQ
ncbi:MULTISPECIES: hypothetical protein [Chryseobacterium]|uniref:hypothetical protein n=1 Tax=Chryseobacterium TaxID=59732 RepID=UPI00240A4D84|nr:MULTISPECIES: hypothetical protein [Chryseobacterium]WFB69099.1 hypothetical protein PZ898_06675 [Chryseobacterium sp. WX]